MLGRWLWPSSVMRLPQQFIAFGASTLRFRMNRTGKVELVEPIEPEAVHILGASNNSRSALLCQFSSSVLASR
eukprot:3414030-Rhodomonas_salina.1